MSKQIQEYDYHLVFETGYPIHITDNFNAKLKEKMNEGWIPHGQHQMFRHSPDLVSVSQMVRRHSAEYNDYMKSLGYEQLVVLS